MMMNKWMVNGWVGRWMGRRVNGWVGGWMNETKFLSSRSSQIGKRVIFVHNSLPPQAKRLRGPKREPADSQGQ